MLYFLILKGYEMHLFVLARIKPFFCKSDIPPPPLPSFNLAGCYVTRNHNFTFQQSVNAICNKFVQDFGAVAVDVFGG